MTWFSFVTLVINAVGSAYVLSAWKRTPQASVLLFARVWLFGFGFAGSLIGVVAAIAGKP